MSDTAEKPKDTYGILTDEGIERLKKKIGIWTPSPTPPHNYEVTWDGVRHFCFGYGDDNPLWCDPEYGKNTRWGGLIGPPNMMYTMGEDDSPKPSPEQKAILKGDPLAGLGSYQSEMEFEWWRPLALGDRVRSRRAFVGIVPRESSFSGRAVLEVSSFFFRNQKSELTAMQTGTWTRAERHESKKRKKEYDLPKPYTDEQIHEIDECYRAEKIRGGETRYWEDVEVGEDMQTIVRGPMRTSDLVVWHVGWGMQLTPPGAFRLSWKIRDKVPGLFTKNPLNVPDTVQRLHWEKEWANELGIPIPYDYGAIRETFLTNICTNWMGDEGWLWKLKCQHRKFVYTGDTYWMKGRVKDKKQEGNRNEVHLEIWCENQWGTITSPGEAVVLLPTRDKPVELPTPEEEDLERMLEHQVKKYSRPE